MGVKGQADFPYGKQPWFTAGGPRFEARTELTEAQSEFIDWLLDPSKGKGTQENWANEHSYSPRTLRVWKKNKLFCDEWERRAAKVNGGIERVQQIIDKLFDQGVGGDVKAMQLYLQYVDKFTPQKRIQVESASVQDLSDEELAAALENVVSLRGEKTA